MTLVDITRQSVLDAIAEHDRIGATAFLAKYGFGPARSYRLEYDGRRYDSKAIAGAAHDYATGHPLRAADFSGGAATVQRRLEALGFHVITDEPVPGVSGSRRSGVAQGVTADQINAALDMWRQLGRDEFMSTYGGNPAERYVVVTEYEEVDALALLLGARKLAGMDTAGPWRGDQANVARPLTAVGFRVDATDRRKSPEVQEAEDAVQVLAGRSSRTGQGQGFIIDQRSKVAIESHAMASAKQHYEKLGTVTDTSTHKSWDYEVDINGTTWHVEVKGTTGDPTDVILTPNEVAHARTYEHVALYVVSNIHVQTGDGDHHPTTSEGKVTIYEPWTINELDLRPLGYKYRLPPDGQSI